MKRIVVGVDGSPSSLAALRTAIDLAGPLAADVEAVATWPIFYGRVELPTAAALSPEYLEADARRTLAEALASVDVGEVDVEQVVLEGDPAEVLLARAAHADLLVVGSRGRGGFAGLLLGSVSQKCVHHAPCPVLVTPAVDVTS